MLSATTLINQRLRARLKARTEARAAAAEAARRRPIPLAARRDPVVAAEEVFGLTVWSRQREILSAARAHERVTVRSGHKVSKSTSAAVLAWWFTFDPAERPKARAILSAPTGRQVSEIVWREIVDLHARATRRGYRLPAPGKRPGTGARWGDGREIVGFTISDGEPEAIAGFSGGHLLFILDEASGIDDRVFEALDGNSAAGARFFLISNPTRTSGAFYRSHQPGSDYEPLHIDSRDSPNVTGEATIPGLATPAWVAKMEAKYGADSLFCRVRVGGEFPSAADDEIFGAELLRAARVRHAELVEGDDEGPLDLGLDVAGFGGDENILAARRGRRFLPFIRLAPGESHEIAARVIRAVRTLRRSPHERPRLKIDANGVGAGVYSVLVSDGFEFEGEVFRPREEVVAIPVNAGSSADDDCTYANLRAELYFNLRDFLRDDGSLPPDALLDEELGVARYALDRYNRILVAPKKDQRKVLGRSPDRGDAAMLCAYEGGAQRGEITPAPPPDIDTAWSDRHGF